MGKERSERGRAYCCLNKAVPKLCSKRINAGEHRVQIQSVDQDSLKLLLGMEVYASLVLDEKDVICTRCHAKVSPYDMMEVIV